MSYVLTLTAKSSGHSVSAPLSAVVPTPTEGGGGWEEVPLPKRGAVLVWKGRGLLKLKLGIVFDALHPVGDAHQALRHMFRPAGADSVPPILTARCDGDVVPYLDEIGEWVLSDLEWAEAIADEAAERIQQAFGLTLTEYRADERLLTAAAAKGAGKGIKVRRHRVTEADLKHGLGGIAERTYHRTGLALALAAAQRPPRTDTRLYKKDIGKYLVLPDHLQVVNGLIGYSQPISLG